MIGKSGKSPLPGGGGRSPNAGSEVTDHYSFQRADFKITEGSPPTIRRVQGESVKYAATRTGGFSEINPHPNQARFSLFTPGFRTAISLVTGA